MMASAVELLMIAASGTLTPYGIGLVVTLPVGVCGLASVFRRIPLWSRYSTPPPETKHREPVHSLEWT